MTIDLDDIIDAIQNGNRSREYYLNTKTGDIILRDEAFPVYELRDIDDELDKYYDNILLLPTSRDAGEVRMMRQFTRELPEGQAKEALNTALNGGAGLFKRFRTVLGNYSLLDNWYEFEDDAYTQFAREWCEENEVAFEEVPKIVYRHATRSDVDMLVELKKKQLGLEDDSLDFELNRYFSNQIRHGGIYAIFAWWKTKIVATGAIAWVFTPPTPELPDGRSGYVCNFWCEEEMKGNGYEEEILNRLLAESRRRKLPIVRSFDLPAELVEKAGFKPEEGVYLTTLKLK